MNQYPDKTCEIENLVRHPKLVAAALAGQKTQQRRDGVYAHPSERFMLDGVEFEVTDLVRSSLGAMTEADVQAEGYPSLEMYKALILSMHKDMPWNDDALVWVHCFKRVDAA
ncbi:MAG: ASCH domain-containing protein [Mariprofundaceae bacterium]